MEVSKTRGTPQSSILVGFSIINHLFWGTTYENPQILNKYLAQAATTSDAAEEPAVKAQGLAARTSVILS